MNKIKIFWNNCEKDQKAVLVSISLIVGLVLLGFTTFIDLEADMTGVYAIGILPLQLVVTLLVGSIMCKKTSKIPKKKLKSLGMRFGIGGILLILLTFLAVGFLPYGSLFSPIVLLFPLLITRSIIFHFKLPLGVLYAATKARTHEEISKTNEIYMGMGYDSRFNIGNINHDR